MTHTKLFMALVFSSFCLLLQGMDQKRTLKKNKSAPKVFQKKTGFFNIFAKSVPIPKANELQNTITIRELPEPTPPVIWQMPDVLQQQDPASCGLHSLKNAILMLGELQCFTKTLQIKIKKSSHNILPSLASKPYFLKTIVPGFKPTVIRFREKTALQEYIETLLKPCLQNTKNEAFRKIIKDGSSAIALQALRALKGEEVYELATTNVLPVLQSSMPKKTQEEYSTERLIQNIGVPKENIIFKKEIVKKAFYNKYLLPILDQYKIAPTKETLEKLYHLFSAEVYDSFVAHIHTIKETDEKLLNETRPLEKKLEQAEDIGPLLKDIATVKRKWLMEKAQAYKLSLPNDNNLLDEFIANPYIFADLQGLWLEGDELRKLIKQENRGIKERIMVIDSIDELRNKEYLENNEELQKIKKQWINDNKCFHAFIINTASQLFPQQRGHWFTVVIHKVGEHKEIIVLNSLKKEEPEIVDIIKNYFEN